MSKWIVKIKQFKKFEDRTFELKIKNFDFDLDNLKYFLPKFE